jgi:hypothetical protein
MLSTALLLHSETFSEKLESPGMFYMLAISCNVADHKNHRAVVSS